MYVHEKLKLNKFEYVRIPSKKEYFARVGETKLSSNLYTGEDTADMGANKTEQLNKVLKEAEEEIKKLKKKENE